LTAELDRNFYVRADDGRAYVLKVAHQGWDDAVLDLQNPENRPFRRDNHLSR
jgi:Ser/Thr protein kinase RdoA (MazF antagonist)